LDAVLDANSGGVMTKRKPRLLDLFCCAGGAAMGYHRAGFEVVGVDIEPQPRYPFEFHQADAMTFPLDGFDAIHASPPCQAYSWATKQWRDRGNEYPDLVAATRQRLMLAGVPYVIENVPGAPLINPVILNGPMFGMLIHRTRLFECSFDVPFFLLPQAGGRATEMGRPPKDNEYLYPVGHFSGVAEARQRMGIDWMNQGELAQAIPPAYTEYIGRQLMALQS
jgi:DNA (cytosine-5)-methyltransferase 1